MFSHTLETIEGIASYPIASLVLFLVCFAAVLVMVVRMKKEHIDKMSHLPLNDQ